MSEVRKIRDPQDDAATAPARVAELAGERLAIRAARANRIKRTILLVMVPGLVVAAATYGYLHAGRFISTDNAYVKSNTVFVAAEVDGTIASIAVHDNDRVEAGAELFRLNDAPYRIALQQADAALAQAATSVAADKLAYKQALAEIELHEAAAKFARTQLERQQGLRRKNLGTVQDLDSASYTLDSALKQIAVSKQNAARLLVSLNGDPEIDVTEHPLYRQAKSMQEQASLDLERTVVRAPFAGIVTNAPDLGDFVEHGRPVMAIVADSGMWVEANFKETQLTYIQPGQPVTLEVDAYPKHEWHGEVQSISEATGAEFALLPPQNATGNWVKIVQRVPVKIVLEPAPGAPRLRSGMSCQVTVDTRHQRTWQDLLPF